MKAYYFDCRFYDSEGKPYMERVYKINTTDDQTAMSIARKTCAAVDGTLMMVYTKLKNSRSLRVLFHNKVADEAPV